MKKLFIGFTLMASISAFAFTQLDLGTSKSGSSISAHLFKALSAYSQTEDGASVVEFGARESDLTEITLISESFSISCFSHGMLDEIEYNCQIQKL